MARHLWKLFCERIGVMALTLALLGGTAFLPLAWGGEAAVTPPSTSKDAQAPGGPPAPAEIVIPEGTPEAVLGFLEKLVQEPLPMQPEAMLAYRQKQARAFIAGADKVIAQAGDNLELIDRALQFKFQGLVILLQLGEKDVRDMVPALGRQLLELADKALKGDKPKKEAVELGVRWSLMAPRLAGPEVLPKILDLPQKVESLGYKELAQAARGSLLALRMQMRSEDEKEALAQDLKVYLDQMLGEYQKNGLPQELSKIGSLVSLLQQLEHSGLDVPAGKYCQGFGEILVKSDDEDVKTLGQQLQGVGRRLGLVGNKMELAGKTLDGKDFDWSQYRGKVVLVDFFATWCGPCRAEMPNIKDNYAKYRDKGFDVVAISVDEDRAALEQYVASEKIPWTIIHVMDSDVDGPGNPARYYGIVAVPTVMLVDKDGTVLTFDVRGPQLGKKLAELLGPAESSQTNAPVQQ